MILIGKIVLLSLFSLVINITNVNETTSSYQVEVGGSIVTDEYMLLVELNDNQDKIATVSVKNAQEEEVFFDGTCNNLSCEYDLSSLQVGNYTVYVVTEGADSFSDNISL